MFAVFAGCSSSTSTNGATSADGGPSATPGATNAATGSMVLQGESFTVPPGGDVTRCTPVRGTNATATYTNRFHSKQAGHHVILYTVDHPIEPGSFEGRGWRSELRDSARIA
jgi:hypothetical protein